MNKTEVTVFFFIIIKLISEVTSCHFCHVLFIRIYPADMQGKGPHRSLNARKAGSPAATVGAACCPGTHRHCKTIEEAGGGGEGLLSFSFSLTLSSSTGAPTGRRVLDKQLPGLQQGKGRDGSESRRSRIRLVSF